MRQAGDIIDNTLEDFRDFPASLNGEVFLGMGAGGAILSRQVDRSGEISPICKKLICDSLGGEGGTDEQVKLLARAIRIILPAVWSSLSADDKVTLGSLRDRFVWIEQMQARRDDSIAAGEDPDDVEWPAYPG